MKPLLSIPVFSWCCNSACSQLVLTSWPYRQLLVIFGMPACSSWSNFVPGEYLALFYCTDLKRVNICIYMPLSVSQKNTFVYCQLILMSPLFQNSERLFVAPWTVASQTPLSTGFHRQEYWSGLPFPSPGDLPDPEIKPGSPAL